MNSPDHDRDLAARIRERITRTGSGFARLSRPALAGGALTVTLVAGTLIGLHLSDGSGHTELAEHAGTVASVAPPAQAPPVAVPPSLTTTRTPRPVKARTATTVSAPPTGLARSGTVCLADTTVPADDGGNYIAITSPGSGCPIVGPAFTVAGVARIFEAALSIDVIQDRVVLHTANVSASEGAPGLGKWSTMFSLAPGNYRIEAYALSPEDGSRYVTDTIWITVIGPGASPPATP